MKLSMLCKSVVITVLVVFMLTSQSLPHVFAEDADINDDFVQRVKQQYEHLEEQSERLYEEDLRKAVDQFDWFMSIAAADRSYFDKVIKDDRQYLLKLLQDDYRSLSEELGKQPLYKPRLDQYSKHLSTSSASGALQAYLNQADKTHTTGLYWKYNNETNPSYSTSLMWKYKNQVNPNYAAGAMNRYASMLNKDDQQSALGRLRYESDVQAEQSVMWRYSQGLLSETEARSAMDNLFVTGKKQLETSRNIALSLLRNVRQDSINGITKLRDDTARDLIRIRQDNLEKILREREIQFGSRITVEDLTITFAPVHVVFDSKRLQLDPAPILVEGNTLVPLRAIAERLGAKVTWNQAEQAVTLTNKDSVIHLKIGERRASLNNQAIELEVAPQLIDWVTMVPVRFISESFAAEVDWDQVMQTVIISR